MSTFVLVHGAWQGASTWDLVVRRLQNAGHHVFTPVLTGLGDDWRRLSSAVNLETHINDVAATLVSEKLEDVTLVGHSYAGMVITGVADRQHKRLSRLVYLDAFVPGDGESALDLLPEDLRNSFREQAQAVGEGWRLPRSESLLDLWGLPPSLAREYVRARLCDFSLPCFDQKLQFRSKAAATIDRKYIAAVAENYPARAVFQRFADKARREGWLYEELPTGHICQVEAPDALVSRLLAGWESQLVSSPNRDIARVP